MRRYKGNFEEIKVLISYEKPACICLQETYHGVRIPFPPSGYVGEGANPAVAFNPAVRPPRGVITLVDKNYAYHRLNINTQLEVVAI